MYIPYLRWREMRKLEVARVQESGVETSRGDTATIKYAVHFRWLQGTAEEK